MTKRQLDLSMMYMFHMGDYYDSNYGRSYRDYDYDKTLNKIIIGIPSRYYL